MGKMKEAWFNQQEIKNHICPVCSLPFNELLDLVAHIKETHKNA